MSNEPESDTITPEAIAVEVMEKNPELLKKYAGGDLAALTALQAKAREIAAGRKVDEKALADTLMRKLGASI